FEQSSEHRVREDFAPDAITQREDGRFLVTLESRLDQRTRFYLLSYGAGLEVLEPEELRQWLCAQAQEIVETYRPK
ncbi:MAG: WYL domain-containing protein, partial [Clostridia bacterium]